MPNRFFLFCPICAGFEVCPRFLMVQFARLAQNHPRLARHFAREPDREKQTPKRSRRQKAEGKLNCHEQKQQNQNHLRLNYCSRVSLLDFVW
jgi:hypothetical protein